MATRVLPQAWGQGPDSQQPRQVSQEPNAQILTSRREVEFLPMSSTPFGPTPRADDSHPTRRGRGVSSSTGAATLFSQDMAMPLPRTSPKANATQLKCLPMNGPLPKAAGTGCSEHEVGDQSLDTCVSWEAPGFHKEAPRPPSPFLLLGSTNSRGSGPRTTVGTRKARCSVPWTSPSAHLCVRPLKLSRGQGSGNRCPAGRGVASARCSQWGRCQRPLGR